MSPPPAWFLVHDIHHKDVNATLLYKIDGRRIRQEHWPIGSQRNRLTALDKQPLQERPRLLGDDRIMLNP